MIDTYFFYPFYDNLNALSKDYRFIPVAAPFVGEIDGIASLIQAAGVVGESAIKGSRNLLHGALSCNTESLKRGSLQIILGASFVGIASIPLIFFRTLRITAGMCMNPVETTHIQAENYRKKVTASSLEAPAT